MKPRRAQAHALAKWFRRVSSGVGTLRLATAGAMLKRRLLGPRSDKSERWKWSSRCGEGATFLGGWKEASLKSVRQRRLDTSRRRELRPQNTYYVLRHISCEKTECNRALSLCPPGETGIGCAL
ncbi:hypothetical protein MRX96_015835 [Rhipicephalus microplus]